MAIFALLNHLVDFLVSPFRGLGPVPQLVLLSLVSTVLLLAVFKRLSNQEKIKRHKDKIFGNFLEIAIYRDQFRRSLSCQANVLKHNLLYLGAIGTPLLGLMLPMLLVCLQLDYRLGHQILRPGDSFIIEAQMEGGTAAGASDLMDGISIQTSETISLDSPAMRIPGSGQVFWQARVSAAGVPNFISISLPGESDSVRKEVAVNRLTSRFSPEKRKMQTLGDILTSGEDPIPTSSPIQTVRVAYPPAEYPFFQWQFSPIVYYFVLTIIFGLLVKPFMKVNI